VRWPVLASRINFASIVILTTVDIINLAACTSSSSRSSTSMLDALFGHWVTPVLAFPLGYTQPAEHSCVASQALALWGQPLPPPCTPPVNAQATQAVEGRACTGAHPPFHNRLLPPARTMRPRGGDRNPAPTAQQPLECLGPTPEGAMKGGAGRPKLHVQGAGIRWCRVQLRSGAKETLCHQAPSRHWVRGLRDGCR
jgi:hypothetical protein